MMSVQGRQRGQPVTDNPRASSYDAREFGPLRLASCLQTPPDRIAPSAWFRGWDSSSSKLQTTACSVSLTGFTVDRNYSWFILKAVFDDSGHDVRHGRARSGHRSVSTWAFIGLLGWLDNFAGTGLMSGVARRIGCAALPATMLLDDGLENDGEEVAERLDGSAEHPR